MSLDLNGYLLNKGLVEVGYREFYRDIFPVGEFERKGVYEDKKPNAIIVEVTDEKRNGKRVILRHTVTDELDKIDEVVTRDNFCLMSPISYIGKSRKSCNARFMYAMAIDLDGIASEKNLIVFFKQIEKRDALIKSGVYWGIPKPTYMVSSGTGLHLYYVFEKPIPLFPNIVTQLEVLKKRITWQIWTQGASVLSSSVQYESLFQGFRMVGTRTKRNTITKAFKYDGGDKISLEELNRNVPDEFKVKNVLYKSDLTLAKAKELYPDWYEKRIVKKQPKGTWVCKRALYEWWLGKILTVEQGHRYWSVMTLATYAKKCAVSYDELVSDAVGLIDDLNGIGDGTDEFTLYDVMHALEAYNDSYITYPIHTIVARTGIPITRNKRNWRKQAQHCEVMRAIQGVTNPDWRNKDGRPKGSGTKADMVRDWRLQNPDGRKIDCHRDTKLSRMTIDKWWQLQV